MQQEATSSIEADDQGAGELVGELSMEADTAVGTELCGWKWEGSLWKKERVWSDDSKLIDWLERRTVQARLSVRKYVACAPDAAAAAPDLSALPLERANLKVQDFVVHQGNYVKLGKGPDAAKEEAILNTDLIPREDDPGWSGRNWGNCAVVGNSGVLRLTQLGQAIDSHDTVFRINQAPLTGYTDQVGSKVTHRLLNRLWSRTYSKGLTKHGKALPLESNVSLIATRASGREFSNLAESLVDRPDVRVVYLSSRATSMVTPLLSQYRERLCAAGYGPYLGLNVPSSGTVAVYMLLRLCQRVTVYGFGVKRMADVQNMTAGGFGYHYYRGVGSRSVGDDVHSFDTEEMLLTQMGLEGVVDFCTYDPDDSENSWACGCRYSNKEECKPAQ